MLKPSHLFLCCSTTMLACIVPVAHAGAKIDLDDKSSINLGLLIQPQVQIADQLDGEGISYDPLVRRTRILLSGKLTDKVHFFAETDNPNIGKQSDWSTSTFIQDAWVEFNVNDALQIDVGMLMVPFSHHFTQGATSLLLTDYHVALANYPAPSHKVWRDTGVMARGELADKKLEYRVAVLNGVQTGFGAVDTDGDGVADTKPVNPDGLPRFAGMVRVSLFDSEAGPGVGGFFSDGLYLKEKDGKLISPKKVLSVGASADYQGAAVYDATAEPVDYLGLAFDIFADIPIGDGTQGFNAQADVYIYDQGEVSLDTGFGLLAEAGYRVNRWEPIVGYDMFDVSEGDDFDTTSIMGGVVWWYMGHATNVKIQGGGSKIGTGDFMKAASVQTQLLF